MGRRIRRGVSRNIFLGIIICVSLQEWIPNDHAIAHAKKTATRSSLVASTQIGGSSESSQGFANSDDPERTDDDPSFNYTALTPIERLRRRLLVGYDKAVPPVLDHRTSVKVQVDLTYRQVLDLDEKNQILKSLIWYRQYWKDEHLTWEPKDYGGIEELSIPSSSVWRPDIAVYEEVGARDFEPRLPFIRLTSDGNIVYAEPTILETSCSVDTAFFPFDSQFCTMTFVSWTQPVTYIDLRARRESDIINGDSADFFIASGEWVLDKFAVKKQIAQYDLLDESGDSVENGKRYIYVPATKQTSTEDVNGNLTDLMYAEIQYGLIIRRNSSLYMQSMLFPSILLTSVALLGFYLPPDSGERVGLQITILLTFMVFLLTVGEMFPASTGPYIGIYFVLSMAQLGVNILMTIIVLHLHFKPCVRNKSSWKSEHAGSWFSSIGSQRDPESLIPVKLRRFLQFCNRYFAIADDGVAWMLPITNTKIPEKTVDSKYKFEKGSNGEERILNPMSVQLNHEAKESQNSKASLGSMESRRNSSSESISITDEKIQHDGVQIIAAKLEDDVKDGSFDKEKLKDEKCPPYETKRRKKTGRDDELQKIINNFRLDVKDIVEEGIDKKLNEKDTDQEIEESVEKEQEEWKSVARAVDRLFFRLYLLLMFVSYVALAGVAINGKFATKWDI